MNKNNKRVTLKSLAEIMDAGFKRMEERFVGVDNKFAGIADKFKGMEGKMNAMESKITTGFEKADKDIESLALMTAESFATMTVDIQSLKTGMGKIEGSVAILEQGQENIQLRIDNLAPHFEVQALTKRVKHLEDKAGIQYAT